MSTPGRIPDWGEMVAANVENGPATAAEANELINLQTGGRYEGLTDFLGRSNIPKDRIKMARTQGSASDATTDALKDVLSDYVKVKG